MAENADDRRRNRSAERIQALRWHFVGYALAMVVLVVANLLVWTGEPWFAWPLVGWGGVLAIHVAYVMGLFDRD